MGGKPKRVGFYLRVSTDGQTVENQRMALQEVAERRGWHVVGEYADNGISGATGRDQRPGLDSAMKDASRRKFDILAFWSIDRLGRSTAQATAALEELIEAGVTIYAHKEGVDGSTPHGKAMLQMAAVFGELERSMIRERVHAGIARAKEQGTKTGNPFGRPRIPEDTEAAVRAELATGKGMLKVAKEIGVGTGTVQRIAREMQSVGG